MSLFDWIQLAADVVVLLALLLHSHPIIWVARRWR